MYATAHLTRYMVPWLHCLCTVRALVNICFFGLKQIWFLSASCTNIKTYVQHPRLDICTCACTTLSAASCMYQDASYTIDHECPTHALDNHAASLLQHHSKAHVISPYSKKVARKCGADDVGYYISRLVSFNGLNSCILFVRCSTCHICSNQNVLTTCHVRTRHQHQILLLHVTKQHMLVFMARAAS